MCGGGCANAQEYYALDLVQLLFILGHAKTKTPTTKNNKKKPKPKRNDFLKKLDPRRA